MFQVNDHAIFSAGNQLSRAMKDHLIASTQSISFLLNLIQNARPSQYPTQRDEGDDVHSEPNRAPHDYQSVKVPTIKSLCGARPNTPPRNHLVSWGFFIYIFVRERKADSSVSGSEYSISIPVESPRPKEETVMLYSFENGSIVFLTYCMVLSPS